MLFRSRGIFNRYASELQAAKNERRAVQVTVTLEDGTKKTYNATDIVNGVQATDLKVGDDI